MIHWIAETDAPVSRWMLGIAMLTIVTSTRSMKAAVITMASANQRRRSAGADPGATGVFTGTGGTGGADSVGGARCDAVGGGGAEEGMART
ncbi:hypothetical protein SCMC78_43470 [Streptomyces sp. CMC78]|uniref:Uncharacterized protein n=1 Tax=Streptomyces sp. CMC78 TaxID=3231512 RepID=A0AB33KPA1_9ACTN